MVKLVEIVPDPSTREFLRSVEKHWGHSWAVELTKAIHEGFLIDTGPIESPTREAGKPENYKQMELLWKRQ